MGYEVKVILGELSLTTDDNGFRYFSVVGSFDLCKVDLEDVNDIAHGKDKGARLLGRNGALEKYEKVYFFEGNEKITEDFYGDPLYAIDPNILLNKLKKMNEEEQYRRFPPIIALLESMNKEFGEYRVILFGH